MSDSNIYLGMTKIAKALGMTLNPNNPKPLMGVMDYIAANIGKNTGAKGSLASRSRVLSKCMFGRYKVLAAQATPQTTHMVMELATDFKDVQIGIPNLAKQVVSGVKVSVGVVAEFGSNAADGSWFLPAEITGPWIDLTVGDLPAAGDGDDTLTVTWTNVTALQSIKRTFAGRSRPLLAIRVEHPANVPITCPYGDFYNWNTIDIYGQMRFIAGTQAVAAVTNKAAYTKNNMSATDSCIPLVRYTVKKPGLQVMLAGDSTVEGTGAQVRAFGSVVRACHRLSTVDAPIEVWNGAINGATADVFQSRFAKSVDDVLPDAVFMLGYSTNDDPGGVITADAINRAWGAWGKGMRAIRKLPKKPVLCLLATNPKNLPGTGGNAGGKALGATDVLRRDFITEYTGVPDAIKVAGYDSSVTGSRTAEGQDTYKDGYSTDNVHLNDVGYDGQAPSVTTVLKTL